MNDSDGLLTEFLAECREHLSSIETDLLAIEVEDRHDELAAMLGSRGLSARVDGSLVLVRMTAGMGDGPYDIVRDTVVDLDLPLIRMEQGRHSLEDLFRAEENDETVAAGAPS